QLADEIDRTASTREIDDLLASLDPAEWHPEARREVLVNYLGFPFWDVLTFPMTRAREIGELNEILIDRISPQDARTLSGFDGVESLKGIAFGHFAAFLSRAYRENDYLLGRLRLTGSSTSFATRQVLILRRMELTCWRSRSAALRQSSPPRSRISPTAAI